MREVVLVSSVRTPMGRAFKGTLRATRPDELAAVAIKGALVGWLGGLTLSTPHLG
jgi:acetyl-CoA acyltransferase